MAIQGTLTADAALTYTDTTGVVTVSETVKAYLWDITNGTTDGKMDQLFHVNSSVTAASPVDHDLAGGVTDSFGNTLTFATVKFIYLKVDTTTTGYYIEIGGGDDGAGNNAFINWVADGSDKIRVYNEGVVMMYSPNDGFAVTATTGDILRVAASAGTIGYEMIIGGTSA